MEGRSAAAEAAMADTKGLNPTALVEYAGGLFFEILQKERAKGKLKVIPDQIMGRRFAWG